MQVQLIFNVNLKFCLFYKKEAAKFYRTGPRCYFISRSRLILPVLRSTLQRKFTPKESQLIGFQWRSFTFSEPAKRRRRRVRHLDSGEHAGRRD